MDEQMDGWMEIGGWVIPQKVCSMVGGAEITGPWMLLVWGRFSGGVLRAELAWWTGAQQQVVALGPSLTTNLVHILQWQTQGLVCGACGGQDGVQGLQEGHATGVPFLPLHFPALEPGHLGRKKKAPS